MSAGAVGAHGQPAPTAGGVVSYQRQGANEMAMQVNRNMAVRRVRFTFEAEPAYEAVVDALCRRYLVSTSELLRRLVVDEARRNGIDVAQAQAESAEEAAEPEEEVLEAA